MEAMGYISKETTSRLMINTLQTVMSGELYFPQAWSKESNPVVNKRQSQVLTCIVEELANKVIAAHINISEATIKMHVTAILTKLGVTKRTEAAIVSKERGIIFLYQSSRHRFFNL